MDSITESTKLINHSGDDEPPVSHNALGPINGVIVPCLLNIVGAVEFLRLSWAVGQAGIGGVMLMFLLGEVLVTITLLSLAALISNGKMRGGGAYYIISRAVGPELGTAIGVLFYLSYSVGSTFYAVSFSEAVVGTFLQQEIASGELSQYWATVGVGSACLLVVLIIGLIGAAGFTKINVPLFVVQFGAIMWGTLTIFFKGSNCYVGPTALSFFEDNITGGLSNYTNYTCGALAGGGAYYGWTVENLASNAWSNYSPKNCGVGCNWLTVFSIIFPAMTGIMEGANLSGDLRDPNKDIWKGTIVAIIISFVIYLFTVISVAGGFDPISLKANYLVMQETSFGTQYIVWLGVVISTFSSALGAVFGGSRILQAIARDDQLPGVVHLGTGYGRGDEPRRAVLATYLIAQLFLMLGNLDQVAGIITTFFLISYSLTNVSLVLVAISGTPNFRPRFKYYSVVLSFVGAIGNIVVMFLLDWLYAVVAIALLVVLLIFVAVYNSKRASDRDWGDVRMALVFHQVRKYLLRMDPKERHGKLWRPSVLLLTKTLTHPLTHLANFLKRGGIFIVGDVFVGEEVSDELQESMQARHDEWLMEISRINVKAFTQVIISPTQRFGCHALISASGLGAMEPNTVVVPLFGDMPMPLDTEQVYCDVLSDAYSLDKAIVVACNVPLDLDVERLLKPPRGALERTLDVIILPHVPITCFQELVLGALPQLTLAHVMLRSSRVSLRVLRLVGPDVDVVEEKLRVVELIKRRARFRVGSKGSQIHVHAHNIKMDPSNPGYWTDVGDLLRGQHADRSTAITLLPLPPLPRASGQQPVEYIQMLRDFTQGLPPTLLIQGSPSQQYMSTDI